MALRGVDLKMGVDFRVTRHKLTLGTQDPTTGWYEKLWTPKTIEMVVVPRGATSMAIAAGVFPRSDAVGLTADPVEVGDTIETESGDHYEVKTVNPHWQGDSFSHNTCDLTLLPLHDLSYDSTAPTVQDARFNTKDYWEDYLDIAELQNHPYIVCYSNPDCPLSKVFKQKSKAIIFAISQPISEADVGHDLEPVGYEEHVPTHVFTLDTKLQWLAEAELRRIVEENPLGSIRTIERKASTIHNFGSTQVFDTEFTLNYWRDTT